MCVATPASLVVAAQSSTLDLTGMDRLLAPASLRLLVDLVSELQKSAETVTRLVGVKQIRKYPDVVRR